MLTSLLACVSPPEPEVLDPGRYVDPPAVVVEDDTGGDTAAVVDPQPSPPTISLAATGGVATVRWTTIEPADGYVQIGENGAFDRSIAATTTADGLHHEALVVGLPAGLPSVLRAVTEVEGETWTSDEVSVTPAAAPDDLPTITVASGSDTSLPGLILSTDADPVSGSVSLFDREGRYVWWHQTSPGMLPLEARLSVDGRTVEWLENGQDGNTSQFHRAALDGSFDEAFAVPNAHHGFVAMPEGGWAVIEYDTRTVDGVDYIGDRLVHIDAHGHEIGEYWNAWDWFVPETDEPGEWTHVNGITYLPDTRQFLISIYVRRSIVLVDADTGTVEWELASEGGDFALPDGGGFEHTHTPRLVRNGDVMFFDNGVNEDEPGDHDDGDEERRTDDEPFSEVVRYHLDTATMTAERTWTYDANEAIYSRVLGSGEQLAGSDDTFIAWGAAGQYTEVDADGNAVWSATLGDGGIAGFSHVLETLGGTAM